MREKKAYNITALVAPAIQVLVRKGAHAMRQFFARLWFAVPTPSMPYCIKCKATYTTSDALARGGVCTCGGTIITPR